MIGYGFPDGRPLTAADVGSLPMLPQAAVRGRQRPSYDCCLPPAGRDDRHCNAAAPRRPDLQRAGGPSSCMPAQAAERCLPPGRRPAARHAACRLPSARGWPTCCEVDGQCSASSTTNLWRASAACLCLPQNDSPMQFEMRLQKDAGEIYQHCNQLLPDCRLLLAEATHFLLSDPRSRA